MTTGHDAHQQTAAEMADQVIAEWWPRGGQSVLRYLIVEALDAAEQRGRDEMQAEINKREASIEMLTEHIRTRRVAVSCAHDDLRTIYGTCPDCGIKITFRDDSGPEVSKDWPYCALCRTDSPHTPEQCTKTEKGPTSLDRQYRVASKRLGQIPEAYR